MHKTLSICRVALSVDLLNMHQVTISSAPPVQTRVIKQNMSNGQVLKQLNLKGQLSNGETAVIGKGERRSSCRLLKVRKKVIKETY